MSNTEKLAKIYATIPALECRGLCQDSCGPIMMSQAEAKAIKDRVGARVDLRGEGRQIGLMNLKTLTCPLLNPDGKCSVYEQRPAICRIWGNVQKMACPHGCRPKKWMTREESYAVLAATEKVQ